MISKYYEIEKLKNKTNFFLFYGENEGQKQDVIQANFSQFTKETTFNSKKNKFELDQLKINLEKNMISQILQDINIYLNIIRNDL